MSVYRQHNSYIIYIYDFCCILLTRHAHALPSQIIFVRYFVGCHSQSTYFLFRVRNLLALQSYTTTQDRSAQGINL
jgi:hypothetical protein